MRRILCVFALLFAMVIAPLGCGPEPVLSNDAFAVEQCPTPAQLASDLASADQADVISLSGVNPLSCPEVQMSHSWDGGKLIFSDSPETVPDRGKLYEDTTLGATSSGAPNRVLAHHVNGFSNKSKRLKVAILLKNLGDSTGTLIVEKSGTAGPTTSFLYAGKLVFHRWLTSTAASPVQVSPGSTVRLVTDIETSAANGYLMSGMYDYSFTQDHSITVCAVYSNDNPLTVCPGLSVLSRDSHTRGTFPYNNKVYDTDSGVVIDSVDGIVQLPLAGNTTNDPNAVGTDKTDSSTQTLVGNYGILYRMHLNLVSSDERDIGFLLNPRGGTWGGAIWAAPGITAGGKFLIPDGTGYTGDNTKGAVAGKYAPGEAFTAWLQWMPTAASNMPLRLVVVPH
jgi:hypothetical protein